MINSRVFHALGGSSDSPRAGTREQEGDTKKSAVCWEQEQFCISELLLLNLYLTSASHKLNSTATGFRFRLENMIKTWREGAESKNSTQKNGAKWRPHSYIYSVTEEGQTELLHKGVNTTFSFYLQRQNNTTTTFEGCCFLIHSKELSSPTKGTFVSVAFWRKENTQQLLKIEKRAKKKIAAFRIIFLCTQLNSFTKFHSSLFFPSPYYICSPYPCD